jgi:heme exporter protein A
MIRARRLVKRFGPKAVLRGLDFEMGQGEFVALLGPNGAGKTTFLRILATLLKPSEGTVTVAGCPLPAQALAVRRRLGVVSHQPLLYGDLTAQENLAFYARMYGLRNIDERIEEVLQLVGLAHRRGDLLREYSRGMQQRLAIARAILHGPEIMLLDEPHTGLDQEAAAMLDGVLREVAARGRTVLMTSHDISRSAELAERVDILSRGVIAASVGKAEFDSRQLHSLYRSVTHA